MTRNAELDAIQTMTRNAELDAVQAMTHDADLDAIQVSLLKLGKAIDSGQSPAELLALVAETLEILRKKQAQAA
jgi:cob(I)alamin adenosyltransferase